MWLTILAAGVGSRLGRFDPKPLAQLATGETLLGRQIRQLRRAFPGVGISVVVGYKKDLIMESFPDVVYVYARNYADSNTASSLLHALDLSPQGDVLWMNGDVVVEDELLSNLAQAMFSEQSMVCVLPGATDAEAVKYTSDTDSILSISKSVVEARGEAVGINVVADADRDRFVDHLRRCSTSDYFERAIEQSIVDGSISWGLFDVSEWPCIEVDTPEDLAAANSILTD